MWEMGDHRNKRLTKPRQSFFPQCCQNQSSGGNCKYPPCTLIFFRSFLCRLTEDPFTASPQRFTQDADLVPGYLQLCRLSPSWVSAFSVGHPKAQLGDMSCARRHSLVLCAPRAQAHSQLSATHLAARELPAIAMWEDLCLQTTASILAIQMCSNPEHLLSCVTWCYGMCSL